MKQMSQQNRILPRPGYQYRPSPPERILPRTDFKPPTLHTRTLPAGSMISSIEAEWCPVCLGREIGEKMTSGKAVWLCKICGNEW